MNKFGVGQPVPRVEDPRFITGRGRYVDDLELPQQCYGVVVMSPHAHARIKRIDTTKAKAAAGDESRIFDPGDRLTDTELVHAQLLIASYIPSS